LKFRATLGGVADRRDRGRARKVENEVREKKERELNGSP
jgi:hypothetical protein